MVWIVVAILVVVSIARGIWELRLQRKLASAETLQDYYEREYYRARAVLYDVHGDWVANGHDCDAEDFSAPYDEVCALLWGVGEQQPESAR